MDNTESDYIKLITNDVMLDKSCTFQCNSVDEGVDAVRPELRGPGSMFTATWKEGKGVL